MRATHNGGAARAGRDCSTIRAATIVRYLAAAGVTFRDVYGFDPPTLAGDDQVVCGCGGPKNHASETCRGCYDRAQGTPCAYVTRLGRRCTVITSHESGYCAKCRRIVERVPKPRPGRSSYLTTTMVILALGEYRDIPIHPWVAARMWQYNAGDVRAVFKSEKSLKGSLVKRFRKSGWHTEADAERAYAELVASHGAVPFPVKPAEGGLSDVATIPLAPFASWLAERKAEVGSYAALSKRTTCTPDRLSKWLRSGGTGTVRRHTIDRALESWGDGTTFYDLYQEAT
jgi:hypothetical protein